MQSSSHLQNFNVLFIVWESEDLLMNHLSFYGMLYILKLIFLYFFLHISEAEGKSQHAYSIKSADVPRKTLKIHQSTIIII